MSGITSRYLSDRHRDKKRRESLRYWVALALSLVAAAGAILVFSRDVAWPSRSQDAARRAKTAVMNGKYGEARTLYMEAIANNPYDYENHLALAQILNHRLKDYEGALRHYLYSLAYSPEIGGSESVRREIVILGLLRSGELENPVAAVEEMFLCAEGGARASFLRRVEIQHRGEGEAYWEGWRKRGKGEVTGVWIKNTHEGFYDAAVELRFLDETVMLVHLLCPLRDIWRLDVGFP